MVAPIITSDSAKNAEKITNISPDFSSVFALQKGKSGQPLLFIPDLGGSVFYARKFLQVFEPEQPVYGFRLDPKTDWSTSQLDIPSLAEKFADDLIRSPLLEPYHLVGHSFAGILAFETARQLKLKGARVGILANLDAPLPPQYRSRSWLEKLLYMPKLVNGTFNMIAYRLPRWTFRRTIERLRLRLSLKRVPSDGIKDPLLLSASGFATMDLSIHPEVYRDLIAHLYHAMTRYQPEPYDGDMMIFKSKIRGFLWVDTKYIGWRHYASGTLDVHMVPGEHLEMVHGDLQISQITKALTDALAKFAEPAASAPIK